VVPEVPISGDVGRAEPSELKPHANARYLELSTGRSGRIRPDQPEGEIPGVGTP